jgi:predicted DCC family thiol-disulfide oxidoreductase YuxK
MAEVMLMYPDSRIVNAASQLRPVVFYDGDCPLCRREIAHYRRLYGSARLRWVDVARSPDCLARHGLAPERAMAELHVLDAAGRWQRGVDAFLVIWSHLPRYHWLARLASTPGLRDLLDTAYHRFAAWRYRQRCGTHGCVSRARQNSMLPERP